MRILQVSPSLSPKYGGGGMRVISELSKMLKERGHEVAIFTSDSGFDQDYIDSLEGVEVSSFHTWWSGVTLHLTPGMIRETRRRLKDFDIIHMQSYRTFQNIIAYLYARRYGIPYIVDAHGINPQVAQALQRGLKWLFDLIFGNRMLRNANRVIAETRVGIDEYKEAGVSEDKIALLYPPRNLAEFSQLPQSGCLRKNFNIKEKHVLLFLGGILWVKGLDFLVQSFHQLVQSRSDIILVIVGPDLGYKTALEKLISELKLSDKVLFTGFLDGERKLSALVDADIVVQTSRLEQGLTFACLEALMCNTPIIVTKNTGAAEDVNRMDGGYLVEFGDTGELCNTIQYILNNPSEAATKVQKAKKYITENLSIDKKIEDYEKLYEECVAENKRNKRRD